MDEKERRSGMDRDGQCEIALVKSERKLRSLLDLGRLIGLDLRLDEMILAIGQKAAETMDANGFRVFLYDSRRDELWSKVSLNNNHEELRFSADQGIAGHCLKNGVTVNIGREDDSRRFREIAVPGEDVAGGTLLSMPFYGRSAQPLGVIQVMDTGAADRFSTEDEIFLQMFGNQVAVFVEMAHLQKARIEALEEARKEAERLGRAKGKALDHLSHELRTPMALIQGTLKILQRRLEKKGCDGGQGTFFEDMERYLGRLQRIQRESDKILRAYHDSETAAVMKEMGDLLHRTGRDHPLPHSVERGWNDVRQWVEEHQPEEVRDLTTIVLHPFLSERIGTARARMGRRNVDLFLKGDESRSIVMDRTVLADVIDGVLKNAVENTPDGGTIEVVIGEEKSTILIAVSDSGIGISKPDVAGIFDGLFHVDGTDLYRSKKAYDFGAGGKGLDLLLAKIYGKKYGFSLSIETKRCGYMEENAVSCPGDIQLCAYCTTGDDCAASGGTTLSLRFPGETTGGYNHEEAREAPGNKKDTLI